MKRSKKKYYTLDEVMKEIKSSKPRPVINKPLNKKLVKIVDKEVISKARKEAKMLLLMANQKEVSDFLFYYHSKSVVLLSVIDSIKDRLVKESILEYKDTDSFGLLCNPNFN